jgi:hypothetical protein
MCIKEHGVVYIISKMDRLPIPISGTLLCEKELRLYDEYKQANISKESGSFVVKTLLSGKQIKTTRSVSEGY